MNDSHLRQYMPTSGRLLLLLRAALTYTDDGGPFLVIRRAGDVFQHDVRVERPAASPSMMCALTGDDALAFAEAHGWQSVMDPTVPELKRLMHQAVTLRDVPMWADDFHTYSHHQAMTSQRERLALIAKGHRAAAQRARLTFVR